MSFKLRWFDARAVAQAFVSAYLLVPHLQRVRRRDSGVESEEINYHCVVVLKHPGIHAKNQYIRLVLSGKSNKPHCSSEKHELTHQQLIRLTLVGRPAVVVALGLFNPRLYLASLSNSDMPHRVKGSRTSCSRAPSLCDLPPISPPSDPSIQYSPMAFVTPLIRKQNVFHFYRNEVNRDNERNFQGWRSELEGKIVELEMDLKDFLTCYVPSSTPLPADTSRRNHLARVPTNVAEKEMYDELVRGFCIPPCSFANTM